MDIEHVGLDLLEHDSFCRLVNHGAEHQHLDYKGPMAWDGKLAECLSLVKDILALANSGGGHLVIGVDQAGDGTFLLTGLSPEQAKTWDTTSVSDTVQNYAEPSVSFSVRVDSCDGKKFSVVSVSGFQRVPHLAKKAYPPDGAKPKIVPWALYVRTAGCQSRSIQSAAEYQDVIDRAVRTRQAEMLTDIRAILIGSSTTTSIHARAAFREQTDECLGEMSLESPDEPYDGVYTDIKYPATFDQARFSVDQLRHALDTASRRYRPDWPFIPYREWEDDITRLPDGFRMEYGEEIGPPTGRGGNRYFYWRIRQSGLFTARSLAWEVDVFAPKGQRVLFQRSLVVHIAQSIDALVNLYTALGIVDEDITWRFEFSGARGRDFRSDPNVIPLREHRPSTEDIVSYERTRSLAEWRAGLVDHAVEAGTDILEQVGARNFSKAQVAKQVRDHLHITG